MVLDHDFTSARAVEDLDPRALKGAPRRQIDFSVVQSIRRAESPSVSQREGGIPAATLASSYKAS